MSPARALSLIRIAVGALAALEAVPMLIEGEPVGVVAAWLALSLLMAAGAFARPAAGGMAVLGALVVAPPWSNLFYLMVLMCLLVAASDCERRFSVLPRGSGSVELWPLTLFRVQLSLVYGFAGLAKLNASWLTGTALGFFLGESMFPWPSMHGWLLALAALGVVVMEIGLAAAAWRPRLRRHAFLASCVLHAGMLPVAVSWLDLGQLLIFAGLMLTLWIAFFARTTPEPGPQRAVAHPASAEA